MSALTRVTAARPSAEAWNTACGLKNAIFAPAGKGAGGCAGGAGGAAGCGTGVGNPGFAGVAGVCAGFAGVAGVCASTGAALSAKSDRATDAAIAEPLITLNPFKVSE